MKFHVLLQQQHPLLARLCPKDIFLPVHDSHQNPDDLRSAMAEEGVIRLLMQDDGLFPAEPPLREEEFSSPLLGRIYSELWRCRGGSSMAALSAALTPEEMSHLTTLLQKPESAANAHQALTDYIRIIREEYAKRSGRSAMDALAAARDTYKDKKGYGGKRT